MTARSPLITPVILLAASGLVAGQIVRVLAGQQGFLWWELLGPAFVEGVLGLSLLGVISQLLTWRGSRIGGSVGCVLVTMLALLAHAWLHPLSRAPSPSETGTAAANRTLVLVTTDTLRRDHVSAYPGSLPGLTPNIDALAAEGELFLDVRAPAPLTLPSHTTMLSGVLPEVHGVVMNGMMLPEGLDGMPLLLGRHGYETAAFVSTSVLHGDQGLGRWFHTYRDELGLEAAARHMLLSGAAIRLRDWWTGTIDESIVKEPGNRTVDRALSWITRMGEKPLFLWVHLYDTHTPYVSRPAFSGESAFHLLPDPCAYAAHPVASRRFAPHSYAQIPPPLPPPTLCSKRSFDDLEKKVADYASEVRFLDHQVGRLLDGLRAAGRYEESVIVVVADHGESLTEHQHQASHQYSLYEPVIAIPLVAKLGAQGIREDPVSTFRIADTFLHAAGLDADAGLQEVVPTLRRAIGPAPIDGAAHGIAGRPLQTVVYEGSLKILLDESGHVERYDLAADPDEISPLVSAEERAAARLRLAQQLEKDKGLANLLFPQSGPNTPRRHTVLPAFEGAHPTADTPERILGQMRSEESLSPYALIQREATQVLNVARHTLSKKENGDVPEEVRQSLEALGYVQ